MTAAERLVLLSGGAGLSAGARLHAIAAGATAGAKLVARSGLTSATAGVHMMYDVVSPPGAGATRPRPMMVYPGAMMSRM